MVLLIVVAYRPAFRAGFIWDDDDYVTANALLTAPDGLAKIWFSTEQPSQYFPLVYTTLRLEHGLWGLEPAGYHIFNILVHCANALLVWTLLRRSRVPAPWLGAALFAVHPVQVESVAWITELKNTESTFFYLASLLVWMKFKESDNGKHWQFYVCALLLYLLALFSKTTACTLPAAMLLVVWLLGRPLRWRTVLQVVPFALLGLAMGLLSIWWEHHLGNYNPELNLSFSPCERLLIASRAFWFYLAKLAWPASLAFSYPRWHIDCRQPSQYLWTAACLLAAFGLWRAIPRVGRSPAAAIMFFVAALSPMLGIIQIFTFRYSYVADHYQYLACLGPLALAAAALGGPALARWFHSWQQALVAGLLVAILASMTWWRCRIYENAELLWQDTLAKNPASWMAQCNLGLIHYNRGDFKSALVCFDEAIRIKPDSFEALDDRGLALAAEGRLDEAQQSYEKAIKINPTDGSAYNNLAQALVAQGRLEPALPHFNKALQLNPFALQTHLNLAIALQQLGRSPDAVAQYRRVLALDPHRPEALNNLAWILATSPDPTVRNGEQALRLAEELCRQVQFQDPLAVATLATACAQTGRFTDAITWARKAEDLAAAGGDQKLAARYHELVVLFSANQPLRETPRSPSTKEP